MLPSISLIVPARNEEKIIKKCVDSLLEADYPKDKLEIIVAIDGSTDRTTEICKGYGKKIRIVESEPKKCKGDALNNVIPQAKGEVIGIYDADCIVDRNSLKQVAKHFMDSNVAGVCGNLKSHNKEQNLITRALALETSFITFSEYFFSQFGANPHFFGKHMFLRKDVIKEVGYFDVDVFIEDVEMSIKLKKYGYKVVFEPNAVAWHEEPYSLMAFWKQRTRWARGTIRLLKNKRRSGSGLISDLVHHIYFYLPPTGLIAATTMLLSIFFGFPIYISFFFFSVFLFNMALLVYSRTQLGESVKDLMILPVWFLLSNLHIILLFKGLMEELGSKEISWNSVRAFS